MSRRLSLAGTTITRSPKASAYIRRLLHAPQFGSTADTLMSAFIEVLVSVIAGAVTGTTTGQRGWGLAVALTMLGLLATAKAKLPRPAVQPVSDVARGGEFAADSTLYGVAQLSADAARSLAQLLSAVTSSPLWEFPPGSTETGPVIDLEKERDELKKALEAELSSVILVYGPPGAGKSTLVSSVLRKTDPKPLLHYLAVKDRLDAKTLLDDIEPDARAGLKPGEDLLGRLKAGMAARGGAPVTIVIDGAQSLFDPDNHLDDLVLAQALEVIASGQPRRVKVILVVQEHPVPGSGSAWHGTADRIFVGGLRREHFTKFLERLNPAFEFALPDRTTTEPGGLYDALQGNPRLAELFCAALGLPESQLSAVDLVKQLEQEGAEEPERRLASEVVRSLSAAQRRVAAALAAYGIPVTLEQVSKLLASELPAGQVEVLVPELVNWHVIGRVADEVPEHYYLPSRGIANALSPDLSFALLCDAAVQLNDDWTPEEKINQLEDLRWHFAELDIRVRAARLGQGYDPWRPSYALINTLDEELRRWKAAGLLLKYREIIEGKLGKSYPEMVNSNALGCIYMSRGRFDDAGKAFRAALQQADAEKSSYGRRKILINLAALAWNSGKTSCARDRYREALEECSRRVPGEATEPDAALDLVTAEEGLADCYQRWGRFSDAIDHGMEARSVARNLKPPSRVVDVTVKLAQWHSELGQRDKADQLMREADEAAGSDAAARVRYLAGHADLLLADGRLHEARKAAKKALKEAPQTPDTATVLQVSTALVMASLRLGKTRAARREIDRTFQLRRAGESLDMLALRALTAFRSAPDGEQTREFFEDLKREAVQRRQRDERDFAAWAFEGLAICGLQAAGTGSLDGATEAFRNARKHPAAPGVDARLKQWLGILQTTATSSWLKPVLAVIDGPAAGPGRS